MSPAEIDPSDLARALDAIEAGAYHVEERLALDCNWDRDGEATTTHAFNDLVLLRSPGYGEAALAVSVDGELFARFAADGVIAATPTGSTAYTLSAGGPILSPLTAAILVTPLGPHGLFSPTLAISASERLDIDVLPSGGRSSSNATASDETSSNRARASPSRRAARLDRSCGWDGRTSTHARAGSCSRPTRSTSQPTTAVTCRRRFDHRKRLDAWDGDPLNDGEVRWRSSRTPNTNAAWC